MYKKIIKILLFFFVLGSIQIASANSLLASDSAYYIKREIRAVNYEIRDLDREISKIQYSDRISEYDKKRKISRLKNQIYYKKRELSRLKSKYRNAIS